jgi:putative membrane protein
MEALILLGKTVALRPYVFVFLAAFLFAGIVNMGWRRTTIFWLTTWAIAFLSEYSSTRNGFPYGFYHYTGTTRGKELYISNVPCMDSLSYSFLLYAAYSMALLSTAAIYRKGFNVQFLETFELRTSLKVAFLTALYMMMIDVVIDPVALRGDRWFLGRIYYYDDEGAYFGVPLTNALGWGITGFAAAAAIRWIDRRFLGLSFRDRSARLWPSRSLYGVGLYYGVLAFNLGITWWIGERGLFLAGIFVFLLPTLLLALRIADPRVRAGEAEWQNHLAMLR